MTLLDLAKIVCSIKKTGEPTDARLSPWEKALVARALAAWVRAKTRERQTANAKERGRKGTPFGVAGPLKRDGKPGYEQALKQALLECPQAEKTPRDWKQDGRSVLANLMQWSATTLHKATVMRRAALEDPAKYGRLKALMDLDGQVEAVYQEYLADAGKQAKYRPSALFVKLGKQMQIPPYVYAAMTYLSADVQDSFVNEFDGDISRVSPADFNRTVKGYSHGAGLENMDTDTIEKALRDMFEYTKKRLTEWILMDPMRRISSAIYRVIAAEGAGVTLANKVEFSFLQFCVSMVFLHGYLCQANEVGLIQDIPKEILKEFPDRVVRLKELCNKTLLAKVGSSGKEIAEMKKFIDHLVSAINKVGEE